MSASRRIEAKIDRLARVLSLRSHNCVMNGMQIDRVWYIDMPTIGRIPIFAFEVEATPKAPKYYKGDLANIQAIGTRGAIILSDAGFGNLVREHKAKISAFAAAHGIPVDVWLESRIDQMLGLVEHK